MNLSQNHPNPKTQNIKHKGWHTRGYLPHLDQPGLIQSITYCLYDAIPGHILNQWKEELQWMEQTGKGKIKKQPLSERIEKYSDCGHGCCWLGRPEIAEMVQNTFLFFDKKRYELLEWCVMPNHVHVLILTYTGHLLEKVIHSWKSYSANKANSILNRKGKFWANDYFDRFIRNEKHLKKVSEYIRYNPVKAGLCENPEDWSWSSASRERQTLEL